MTWEDDAAYTIPIGGQKAPEKRVQCPACSEKALGARFGCRSVFFYCSNCRKAFEMDELAKLLDEESFESLSEMIGHRFCDRI